jgi:hypothetical protein
MKKIKKNHIFAFILGAITFGSIGAVSAYTIVSKDITYTPKDATWNVNNVSDALDNLYTSVDTYARIAQYISVVDGDMQSRFDHVKDYGYTKFKISNVWNSGATCIIKLRSEETWTEEDSPYQLDTIYDIPSGKRLLLRAQNGQCDFQLVLYK